MHRFTQEQIQFLEENYPQYHQNELVQIFNEHFYTALQPEQIRACLKNHKIRSGRTGRFLKGHVPVNKGKKGISYPGMKATQFKKGHKPVNHRPVGSERVTVDGYIEVKVAEQGKWRLKHQVVWENSNGVIPKGYGVIFLDGNRQNVSLHNLALVTQAQRLMMNRKRLAGISKEITETGIIIADLMLRTGSLRRNRKR